MKNKISTYLYLLKIKYILSTIFFLSLFVQIINILEVSRVLENKKLDFISLLYFSFLKLPNTLLEIIPFAIVISTAFLYRYLITNNELISMRNVGYSIIDIFKPISLAILTIGLIFLFFLNPISAKFENKFEYETSKDFSDLYSIKIKNNEIWIKNLNKDKLNFIKFSNIDLKKMEAEGIKIVEIDNQNQKFYIANKAKLNKKNLILNEVQFFEIYDENFQSLKDLNLTVNFNKDDIVNSISNYKNVPFYNYNKHLRALKKFNLYSSEISFYYIYELLKPLFLIVLSFLVMGFASKFKRNENFFKILFLSISVGFCFFIYKEILIAFININYLSFWFGYLILLLSCIIIGLYQSINIELN